MKRFTLACLIAFISFSSYSQGISLGVKAGANFANIQDAAEDFSNKTGFVAGAFLGLKLSERFAIQPELLYSQQGAEFNAEEFNLDYVNIPVLLKFYLVDGLNIQAGPQFGFVVNDDLADSVAQQLETEDYDLSGIAGVGYDLPFGFSVEGRYNFGLTDIFENADGKNEVFSVIVGYSFL